MVNYQKKCYQKNKQKSDLTISKIIEKKKKILKLIQYFIKQGIKQCEANKKF